MTPSPVRYYRRIIKIKAEDSPNVHLALEQIRAGREPTGEIILPGVLPYSEYVKRRATWDAVRQCIGLDAEFWEGKDALMFPPEWLNIAEQRHRNLIENKVVRKARAIGVDPAEGGDKTAWAIVDEYGLMDLISIQTPNTTVITSRTIALMTQYDVPPERVMFDRGGGGKQHSDRLNEQGYDTRTVGFGEAVTPELKRGLTGLDERKEQRAERYVYKNRRAHMYGTLRELLDPSSMSPTNANWETWRTIAILCGRTVGEFKGFAIPPEYVELRRQLAPIPLYHDGEGRMYLLPKSKPTPGSKVKTLTELIGCSPDEADAFVLGIYGMVGKTATRPTAGAVA